MGAVEAGEGPVLLERLVEGARERNQLEALARREHAAQEGVDLVNDSVGGLSTRPRDLSLDDAVADGHRRSVDPDGEFAAVECGEPLAVCERGAGERAEDDVAPEDRRQEVAVDGVEVGAGALDAEVEEGLVRGGEEGVGAARREFVVEPGRSECGSKGSEQAGVLDHIVERGRRVGAGSSRVVPAGREPAGEHEEKGEEKRGATGEHTGAHREANEGGNLRRSKGSTGRGQGMALAFSSEVPVQGPFGLSALPSCVVGWSGQPQLPPPSRARHRASL